VPLELLLDVGQGVGRVADRAEHARSVDMGIDEHDVPSGVGKGFLELRDGVPHERVANEEHPVA
jgi:hypothetical protein